MTPNFKPLIKRSTAHPVVQAKFRNKNPLSTCLKILMICTKQSLLFFIKISSHQYAEKMLLENTINFRGNYRWILPSQYINNLCLVYPRRLPYNLGQQYRVGKQMGSFPFLRSVLSVSIHMAINLLEFNKQHHDAGQSRAVQYVS